MADTYTKIPKPREKWIDVLKGVGIILVIIGHTSLDNILNTWIYTFHMPLFFVLSGYLWGGADDITFKDFFVKRVKTILWPFIFFRILLYVYWIIIESHFRALDLGPIWFLIVLFIVEMTAFLLLTKGRKRNCPFNFLLIGVLIAIWMVVKKYLPETIIFSWMLRCINGLIWYLFGQAIRLLMMKSNIKTINQKCRYNVLIVTLTISILISIINPGTSMWSNTYGKNVILYFVGGLFGSAFVALFCKWLIRKNLLLEFLGKNTIIILAIHEPVKRVILKISETILGKMNIMLSIAELQNNIILSLIVVAMVVLLDIIVIYFFRFIKTKMPDVVQRNFLAFVK